MPDRAVPAGTGPEPSRLEILPGLAELAEVMADAVAVTDLHRRVVVWNGAAARLYGISADQAIGVADRCPVCLAHRRRGREHGRGTDARPRVRLVARPRRQTVPSSGGRPTANLVLDVVLSRLDDPAGAAGRGPEHQARQSPPRSASSQPRDARVARHRHRRGAHRETLAARALQLAIASTGASHGLIAIAAGASGSDPRRPRRLGGRGPARDRDRLGGIARHPGGRRRRAGHQGPVRGLPLTPMMRRALIEARHPDARSWSACTARTTCSGS